MFDRATLDDSFLELLSPRVVSKANYAQQSQPIEKVEEKKVVDKPVVKPVVKPKDSKPKISKAEKKIQEEAEKEVLREVTKKKIASLASKEVEVVVQHPQPLPPKEPSESPAVKEKRKISPEHLAKMRAGKAKKKAEKAVQNI